MRIPSLSDGSLPTWEEVKRRILGPPERLPQRALTVGLVVTLAIALTGVWAAATSDVEAGSSSLPYLRPILGVMTSVWLWIVLLAWLLRRVLVFRDRRYANQAANITGYESDDIRRLAYESKSPDGATRVIATSEDSREAIADRILEALATGEDDTVSLNPEAFATPDDGPEIRTDGGSPSGEDEDDGGWLEWLQNRVARLPQWLLVGVGWIAVRVGRGLDVVIWKVEAVLERVRDTEETPALPAGPDPTGTAESTADDFRDPWREQFKLLRLDVASTLDFDRLFWSFAVPAAATVALLLVAVRLWVQPYLYPPILAAGVLVGLLNYVRVSWRTSRRLEALREETDGVDWSDAALLVKEVETPATRAYYGWLAGRRYAHDDREEFARELAKRVHELVNNVPISPSVMEKQARQFERYQPDLHGFRDAEREAIMTWLLERVEDAEYGLIPKAKLIEDCVEHDIQSRRIGPGKTGKGYDPELVRAAYRELVPAALVEQEISLEDDEASVVAVRMRDDPIPPAYGEVRAHFSNQFSNYARWEPLYELPDVSDRLEEEPTYVGALGARTAEVT